MRKLFLATVFSFLPALALAQGGDNGGNSSSGTPFSITSSTTYTIGSGSQADLFRYGW